MYEPSFIEIFYWSILPAGLNAAAIFAAVYIGLRLGLKKLSQRPGGRSAAGERSAPEILRERYARGEISRRDYELMREDLRAEEQDAAYPVAPSRDDRG